MKFLLYAVTTILVIVSWSMVNASDLEINRCLDSAPVDRPDESLIFFVSSSGKLSDATFISLSKRKNGSPMSKNMSKIFYKGRKENQAFIVCGPSPAKTAQVLKDTLNYSIKKKRKFPNLQITYVGSSQYFDELSELSILLGASMITAELKSN